MSENTGGQPVRAGGGPAVLSEASPYPGPAPITFADELAAAPPNTLPSALQLGGEATFAVGVAGGTITFAPPG